MFAPVRILAFFYRKHKTKGQMISLECTQFINDLNKPLYPWGAFSAQPSEIKWNREKKV